MAKALPSLTIPTTPEELSAGWLTAALRAGGVPASTRVASFASERLGQGEGFVGTIVRLHLRWEPPHPSAPATAIAKLPISLARNKALGELGGAYEREIRFYRELADRVPIRTPRCYYGDFDPNPLTGREEAWVRLLERFPGWLIRLALPLFQWLSARRRRRYVLLLEDLAPARVGDQVAGCTPGEAEAALRALAALHAAFWGRVETDELSWLPRIDALRSWFHVVYRRNWPGFVQAYGARLPGAMTELARWLEARGPELMARLGAMPRTLLHGDYRLDNMCLADEPGGVSIAAFDWQGPTRGPGVFDAAYFLPGSLPSGDAALERELLGIYHGELVERGVGDYSFEACRAGYELAKLAIAYRFIMGVDMLDLYHERGAALMDTWLARQAALLPPHYPALLSRAHPDGSPRGA